MTIIKIILCFTLFLPMIVFARDPFLATKTVKIKKDTRELSWITLRYTNATELVTWLRHQKGLSEKNVRFGADVIANKIWINAEANDKIQFMSIIKRVDQPKKQIKVSARFVRINSAHENKMGVNWQLESNNNGAPKNFLPRLQKLNVSPGDINVRVGTMDNEHVLDMELKALENNGEGKVIAAPNLLLTDGSEASIESGQKIPYQEKVNNDNTATHFEKAVLGLVVLANSLPDNKIAMDLTIHQDKPLGYNTNFTPSISTQVVKTHVIVKNGHIIVLGGIYENVQEQSVQKIPLLGDIPIIGGVFSHREQHNERTQLLVYIQPRIVSE